MRAHILASITFSLFLGVQAAYPQAAAESVLLNSNSATATVKAGSAMGKALNKASSKLGNQVQRTVAEPSVTTVTIERTPRTPAPTANKAAPPAATKPAPAGGSLITSIQGGHVTRSSSTDATPTSK
jgi:hypothetical protein